MLISHIRRFIYLKTVKTAGTSVEVFFEKECVPPHLYGGPQHFTDGLVSEHGIVGFRGWGTPPHGWYHHMPAAEVRARIGEEIWLSYFKFCVVRNPFDKVVSWWWFRLGEEERARLKTSPFTDIRDRFNRFVQNGEALPHDRDAYMIDGTVCVDRFLRYEHLLTDLGEVCARLDIPFHDGDLGHYKAAYRESRQSFADYYDDASARRVADSYGWEIDAFGYCLGSG